MSGTIKIVKQSELEKPDKKEAKPTALKYDPTRWDLLLFGLTIMVIGVLLQIYVFGVPDLTTAISLETGKPIKAETSSHSNYLASSKGICSNNKLWKKEDLAQYDGSDETKPILLAVIGEVFDVTKGGKHYGKEGGYSGFAGKDGSRAFVTGKFDAAGLTSDTSGLKSKEIISIDDWLVFYRKDYTICGKLIGHYYNAKGEGTAAKTAYDDDLEKARKVAIQEEEEKQEWPGCNSRWSDKEGRSLWCSTESGGVKRPWIGRPRQFFNQASQEKRCVCAPENKLKDPRLKEYDGCDPQASGCSWPK